VKLKKLERDVMPAESATNELLRARTSRERKVAQQARDIIWVPDVGEVSKETQEEIKIQQRYLRRVTRGKAIQLAKWLKRVHSRRRRLQEQYEKTMEQKVNLESALTKAQEANYVTQVNILTSQLHCIELVKASLDNRAKILDMAWECLEQTAEARGMKL
jgi:hypothetical protein